MNTVIQSSFHRYAPLQCYWTCWYFCLSFTRHSTEKTQTFRSVQAGKVYITLLASFFTVVSHAFTKWKLATFFHNYKGKNHIYHTYCTSSQWLSAVFLFFTFPTSTQFYFQLCLYESCMNLFIVLRDVFVSLVPKKWPLKHCIAPQHCGATYILKICTSSANSKIHFPDVVNRGFPASSARRWVAENHSHAACQRCLSRAASEGGEEGGSMRQGGKRVSVARIFSVATSGLEQLQV